VSTFQGIDFLADVGKVPLPDSSVERIYAGHCAEHIPLTEMHAVLREWHRLLVPGGSMMIVIPDIEQAIRRREPWELLDRICTSSFPPPDGHAWTATAGVMRYFLEGAGFACTDVPLPAVNRPEWPIVAQPEWQSAIHCTK
jgi:predicted SAM-dependent methyltransferase